jgi:THO complex subunit 4
MTVVYDAMQIKRVASAPSTASLLNRVQKPPLLERLSKDDTSLPKLVKSTEPRSAGPIRNRRGGGAAPQPRRKKPMTADDLDKELDAFMQDDDDKAAASKPAPPTADTQAKEGDVEMA